VGGRGVVAVYGWAGGMQKLHECIYGECFGRGEGIYLRMYLFFYLTLRHAYIGSIQNNSSLHTGNIPLLAFSLLQPPMILFTQ